MSSTVQVGGLEISSNSDTPASMIESLTPEKEGGKEPRLLVDEGKPVEQTDDDKDEAAKAAAVLGKKGGEAAAAKRAADAKDKDETAKKAEEEAKAKKAGNPRHDPTARVTEATREAREAREEAARERQERERLAAELARERAGRTQKPAEEPKKAAPADDDPEPQESDFGEYKDYVKAVARNVARQENREIQKKAAEQERHAARGQHIERAVSSFDERMKKAAAADPTIRERTVELAGALRPSFALAPGEPYRSGNAIADEIIDSEHAPALMLYFAENVEELQRFAALGSPRAIAREMAKLEARLETGSAAATAGASAETGWTPGKPPVRPVTGAPHVAEPDVTGEMNFDTFMSRKRARA